MLLVKQVVAAGGEVPSQKHLASLWRAACTLHTRAPNRIFPWFVFVRPVLPFCSPLLWPRPELIHDGRACNRSAHPRPESSDQLQPSLQQKSRAACPAAQRRKRRWVGQACGARPFGLRLLLIGGTSSLPKLGSPALNWVICSRWAWPLGGRRGQKGGRALERLGCLGDAGGALGGVGKRARAAQ